MNKLPLTKEKKDWIEQFKPTGKLRGTPLNYNAAVQARYQRALTDLTLEMTRECRKAVLAFFREDTAQEFFAADESISSQARILTNELQGRFEQLFSKKSGILAKRMVRDSDKASSASLHNSLKDLSGGMSLKTTILTEELKEVMTATVNANVGLIRSIASEYLAAMQGAVMRSITTGQGLKDLVPFFSRYEGITVRRARNIALDQTRKAYNGINAGRLQALNLDEYEWIHSGGGQEPRKLHQHLAGKICSLSKPPIIQYAKGAQPEVRGKPGDLVFCGCTMRPIISFDKGVAGGINAG